MGLKQDEIDAALAAVAASDPAIAALIAEIGVPGPRIRERGFETLARTIVGQQISVAAADSMWAKLESVCGGAVTPAALAALTDEQFRAAGQSRQKTGYLRSLADEVTSGRLDLANLPDDDEEAIAALVRIKGIGRWSAEIYLLFAEGRPDIWPAGDLAVQIEVGRILKLDEKPAETDVRAAAERWRPHRGAMAILAWHSYGAARTKSPL